MRIASSILIVLFFLTFRSSAQTTTIRKNVLLIKKFVGKYRVLPKDSTKSNITVLENGVIRISVSNAGDSYILMTLTYYTRWSFDAQLSNLHKNHQPYIYNDIFLTDIHPPTNDQIKEMKVDPVAFLKLPKISFQELNQSNTTYIGLNSIEAACKAWLIDADWDVRIINYKPKYLSGIAPDALKFGHYFIHTLSKIYGITPLEQLEEGASAKVFKEGVLK